MTRRLLTAAAFTLLGAAGSVAYYETTDTTEFVHVPGYSPQCVAAFGIHWRDAGADPRVDSATHNANLKRVKDECDGWPWTVLDLVFYYGREADS